jgi:glycosyltransferase involved in cell wall biosynthesis
MRLVFLNPSGQLGGAEKSLLDLLLSLRAADTSCEMHLIASAEGPLIARARALGVPATALPFPPALARLGDAGAGGPAGQQIDRLTLLGRALSAGGATAAYLRRLRDQLKQLGPDIIHTNGLKMHLLGLLARPRQTPVVWHLHDYVSARPLMARLIRASSPRCSTMITCSKSVAADIRALCGPAIHVQTVYNGVDTEVYAPEGPSLDLDALAGLPPASEGVVRIGMIATMARWKGHEVFLQALAGLPEDLPIRAYLVGDAVYQTDGSQYSLPELRRIAARLGVEHRVGFTGFLAEPAAAMRACDIIVHASTQPEPFGLVIAEALACGRAVIVSLTGGASELIDSGVTALHHEPGNAPALAACITRLAGDADLRTRLGRAGRAAAVQRFDRRRLACQVIPIYHRVRSTVIHPSALGDAICVNK